MAIDAYMWFQDAEGLYLDSESQVDFSKDAQVSALGFPPNNNIFEVEDYSFDITQVLSIGSQSSGVGAGKVTFDPLIITRKTDRASPIFYQSACSGMSFQFVVLVLCKSAGGAASATVFEKFTFKLVGVKSIAWAYDAEEPKEIVTFEYGGLVIEYWIQQADGSMGAKVLGGWNRVKNISDSNPASVLI
jgi:type VI protein secretion system component Hcp